ncbi:MAG TPA: universal stress protein [Chloroflexota bacterium]|nr:universal stress protein [Chloroflexota bacterium]
MKRLLVGYDGSLFAAEAARLAGQLALRLGATVSVHCASSPSSSVVDGRAVEVRVPRVVHPAGTGGAAQRTRATRPAGGGVANAAAGAMAREGAAIVRSCGVAAGSITATAERGAPAEVLVEAARRERADLIVVGHRGRGALTDVLLGGVARRVASAAPCPVLVVRGTVPQSISQVLVATNGSVPSQRVTEAAAVLARAWGAGITLLYVIDSPAPAPEIAGARKPYAAVAPADEQPDGKPDGEPDDEERARAERALAWATDVCRRAGVQVEAILERGPVAQTILALADAREATLIAIGRPDSSRGPELELGRDSDALLSGAPGPVLIAGERVEDRAGEAESPPPPAAPAPRRQWRRVGPLRLPAWLWFWER